MESEKDEAALLDWVNSFPLNEKVHDLGGLHDGIWLWEMLRDIDPIYFTGKLPEGPSNSGKWLSRWQNLKHISRSLISYIVEERGQVLPKDYPTADLKSIASDSRVSEVLKFLKLILLAAISSPKTMEYVGRMQTLSVPTQARLKNLIQDVLNGDASPDNTSIKSKRRSSSVKSGVDDDKHKRDTASSLSSVPDIELLFEERFGTIMSENKVHLREKVELHKDLRELHDRVARLQDNNDALQDRLTQAEDRLEVTGSADHADKESSIKQLELQISRQENIIADQEVKLFDHEANIEALQKTIDKLQPSASTVQKLTDELDEIKAERDSLAKKANTVERYKQKLQASQGLQKDNTYLREELEEIRGRFVAADEERQTVGGLQLRVNEYEKILPTLEQDRHQLQLMKKQLEFENIELAQRWNAANEQHALDQESIADLNEKLEDLQRRASSLSLSRSNDSMANLRGLRTLSSELEKSTRDEEQLQVASIALHWTRLLTMSRYKELSELQAENQQLKAGTDNQGSKNTMLQQLLDQANEKLEDHDKRYLEMFQEKLSLESSLESITQGDPIQSTDVFRKTRDKVAAEQKKNLELQAELSLVKSKLQAANNNLSLLGMDEHSALAIMKENESAALTGLQQENKQLKQKSLLRNAMGNRKALQENPTSTEQLKATSKEVAKPAAAGAPGNKNPAGTKVFDKQVDSMAQVVLKDREQLAKLREHIQQQDLFIQDLENRTQAPRSKDSAIILSNNGPPSHQEEDPTSARILSQQGLIRNLERELKLMASAYHDLAGRLQMNTVLLQRRSEVPRSWLNKQRKLVDHSVGVVGR